MEGLLCGDCGASANGNIESVALRQMGLMLAEANLDVEPTARYPQRVDWSKMTELLSQVAKGSVSVPAAASQLRQLPIADVGVARVDHHRALRQGVPEVIFGESKRAEDIVAIARELSQHAGPVLITRVSRDAQPTLAQALPELDPLFEYNPVSRTFLRKGDTPNHRVAARVTVVTAGTSDAPVAQEAVDTLSACGVNAKHLVDVGVAGLHRILAELEALQQSQVVIVVAGMEGALPSVVGGLVACPVLAVPTSVGYGAALSGFSALFGMLTSCASGVSVFNIDNGFGAAIAAVRMIDSFLGPAAVERNS